MARSDAQTSLIRDSMDGGGKTGRHRTSAYLTVMLAIAATLLWLTPVGTQVPAADPNIEYIGRWDKSDPSRYHSYWGGAY